MVFHGQSRFGGIGAEKQNGEACFLFVAPF